MVDPDDGLYVSVVLGGTYQALVARVPAGIDFLAFMGIDRADNPPGVPKVSRQET